jgi:hypothetical protein
MADLAREYEVGEVTIWRALRALSRPAPRRERVDKNEEV